MLVPGSGCIAYEVRECLCTGIDPFADFYAVHGLLRVVISSLAPDKKPTLACMPLVLPGGLSAAFSQHPFYTCSQASSQARDQLGSAERDRSAMLSRLVL